MSIKISEYLIGKDHNPFIMAEAGLNHNGDLDRAFEMIKIANWISQLIDNPDSTSLIESIQKDVVSLCKEFPLYEDKNEMHELSA